MTFVNPTRLKQNHIFPAGNVYYLEIVHIKKYHDLGSDKRICNINYQDFSSFCAN